MATITENRETQTTIINRLAKVLTSLVKNERFTRPELIELSEEVESLLRRVSNCTVSGRKGQKYLMDFADNVAELDRYVKADDTSDEFETIILSTRLGFLTTADAERAVVVRKAQIEAQAPKHDIHHFVNERQASWFADSIRIEFMNWIEPTLAEADLLVGDVVTECILAKAIAGCAYKVTIDERAVEMLSPKQRNKVAAIGKKADRLS